jgi:cobalt-zinc-cadmium efflux system outer membrane protein
MNQSPAVPYCRTIAIAALLVVTGARPGAASGAAPQQPAASAPAQAAPLTYQAALDLASTRNLGVVAAMRQRAIREAEVRIAGQRPNPDFSFEATRDTPHEVLSFGFPIEIGGKRARRIELAQEEMSLADLDVKQAQRTLRRNLRQAFYGLLAADERVRDGQAVLAIAQRVRDTANARFTEGAAPRLEVMEADLGVARVEAEIDLAQSSRQALQADLNAVLNQPPDRAINVTGDLAAAPTALTYADALKVATDSNVDLVRADREIAIERRRTSVLRAERTPTPTFSVGGVFDAPGEFTAGVSAGLGLTIPLFSRNQGEIAQSTATVSQLQAERESAFRTLEASLYGAWARLQALRKQADVYREKLVPTATDLEALAEESYRAGRSPVLTVLDAQRNLRDVRREYLQALADYQAAIADLEEILGAPII